MLIGFQLRLMLFSLCVFAAGSLWGIFATLMLVRFGARNRDTGSE